jgi:hypothetical protein
VYDVNLLDNRQYLALIVATLLANKARIVKDAQSCGMSSTELIGSGTRWYCSCRCRILIALAITKIHSLSKKFLVFIEFGVEIEMEAK